jgi:hypothetical protein
VEGNFSHGYTAASGSTARGSEAAAPEAPEFEYQQGMQANPTEVSRAEMMQEQKWHTHTLHLSICA